MQRYHTIQGTSDGLYDFVRMEHVGLEIMRMDTYGHWVKFNDAQKAADASRAEGLAQGRKDGETKVTSLLAITDSELKAAYERGVADGVSNHTGSWSPPSATLRGTAADVQVCDTRTNQLLNELYHDRARLEHVVKILLLLSQDFVNGLAQDLAEGSITQDVYDSYDELIGAHTQANNEHGDNT